MSPLVALDTALETTLEATETAAAQAEERRGVLWYEAFKSALDKESKEALLQSEQVEEMVGRLAARAFSSTAALSCISAGF